jgi:crotonobetainyl-CoA:carnitine CoA-transferase CaiB-like acyl-CoA transferase
MAANFAQEARSGATGVTSTEVSAPLAGIKVLEISTRPAGAYCGRVLRLLGANVTRVDLPLVADCMPAAQPELLRFLSDGKTSVGPDIDLVGAIAAESDLIVVDATLDDPVDGAATQLVREVLASPGLDTPIVDVATHRASATSDAPVPSAPITACAIGGMSWAMGYPDREPLMLPADLPDYLAGVEAAGAAALVLLASGGGAAGLRAEVSASETIAYYVGQICANFIPYERPWHRDGPRATMSGGSYPGAMFVCSDGNVSIMCRTTREWHALLRAMGDPDWSQQDRFRDQRVVARLYSGEADKHLGAWTVAHTCAEMFELGTAFGFPVAPVLPVLDAIRSLQFAERGFIQASSSGSGLQVPGVPWRLSEVPVRAGISAAGAPVIDPRAPLAGIRVLDLSWVWSGPMVTAALRDLGAEVIKIENRQRADPARLRGRGYRGGLPVEGPELEVTPYFNQMNRGKRSVAVDIASDAGRAVILDLVQQCDVVVENMRPGALARRNLGYEQLADRNPSLVMLSMSIMGQTGPMRSVGGYAPVMSGLAGLDSIVGYASDDLIGLYNPSLGDPNGAAHAMAVLLAALVRRQRSGLGCWIDLAQVECLVSVMAAPIIEAQILGASEVRGNGHATWWPHGAWRCLGEDEWVALAARTDRERERLAELVGLSTGGGSPGRQDLAESVRRWAAVTPAEDASAQLTGIGIPAARVDSFERLVASAWAHDRDLCREIEHPYLGRQSIFSLPWKLNGASFVATAPAPLLGADTDGVLREILAADEETLAELRADKAIE